MRFDLSIVGTYEGDALGLAVSHVPFLSYAKLVPLHNYLTSTLLLTAL
jgi:hypothetical protein